MSRTENLHKITDFALLNSMFYSGVSSMEILWCIFSWSTKSPFHKGIIHAGKLFNYACVGAQSWGQKCHNSRFCQYYG